jgi:hypothetical protein
MLRIRLPLGRSLLLHWITVARRLPDVSRLEPVVLSGLREFQDTSEAFRVTSCFAYLAR